MTRYDAIVAESETAENLCMSFADKLVQTMQAESGMHPAVA